MKAISVLDMFEAAQAQIEKQQIVNGGKL